MKRIGFWKEESDDDAKLNEILKHVDEHGHGLEKKHTELKNIQASDLDTFEIHLGMHVISRLTLALMRLQNGISEGLLNLGGVEF